MKKKLLSFRYFNHLVESNWDLIIYRPDVITVQITPGHRASWNVTTCLLWCFVQTCLLKCCHTRIVPVDGSSLNQQSLAWTIDWLYCLTLKKKFQRITVYKIFRSRSWLLGWTLDSYRGFNNFPLFLASTPSLVVYAVWGEVMRMIRKEVLARIVHWNVHKRS